MSAIWTITTMEMIWRLVLAVVLGGAIGWQREHNNHPAGLRTHILVSLGAALIMLLSIYGFSDFVNEPEVQFDPARIAAQVVSGIGFLGAGTIMRHGVTVTGLTTAASLWVVAGIGLAIGAGFLWGAIITTTLALVSLEFLNKAEALWIREQRLHILRIRVTNRPGVLKEMSSFLEEMNVNVRKVKVAEETQRGTIDVTFTMRLTEGEHHVIDLMEEIRMVEGVVRVYSE
ncbi:MgtC/SapB family protein [Mechercharimyces sp. CAU 1602]|uniref:MgtC/SapB family protein n=1 Tax=Mechercharimyces sp. CAU 1602 TaxID=2973933 RepID=UPI002162CB32|nr:MgtC/SapB family protein [Mechercharimyces sp. CAU 1602]MCS1352480.1 MgtC/SapB family protein [Mechercharimyces sp. CAU 1602]